jgi:cyclase
MLRYRVIPCLLLSGRGLVKTTRFRKPQYVGDPVNAVRIFNEKEVDELLLLDITASREGRGPQLDLIQDIARECFMPMAYGGGVSDIDMIAKLFQLGVEKVALNSAAVANPALVEMAAKRFGSQSVIVSMDVKRRMFGRYEIQTVSGTRSTSLSPQEQAKRMESLGAGEILVNSIDRDGTMAGYDIDLVQTVARSVQVPVIACGGAGRLEDFGQAIRAGASAVAAGSMFVFQGRHRAVLITYPNYAELERLLS